VDCGVLVKPICVGEYFGALRRPHMNHLAGERSNLMANRKPDYRVMISRKNGDKSFYTEVGAGWNVAKDGISLQLHALPTDGRLVLFPRKDDE
jgi:uncharacterized protein (DUF736 family)